MKLSFDAARLDQDYLNVERVNSRRKTSLSASRANFVGECVPLIGVKNLPAIELMLIMRPAFWCRMCGTTARIMRIIPNTLTSNIFLNLVDRDFLDRAAKRITGVVDQDIDPAKALENLLDGTVGTGQSSQ